MSEESIPLAPDPAGLLEAVTKVAVAAGEEILAVYNTDFAVEHKADCSPLTKADLVAHRTILQGLTALTPNVPVLSEEAGEVSFGERRYWQRYWLVDPLDGTREFVKRNGEFTVNIALVEAHEPVLGVVYGPVQKVLYFACRGRGAYKKEAGTAATALKARSWTGGTALVVGSRSHAGEHLRAFLDKVGDCELVSMGSSLKICLVAEGKADVYPRFGLTSEWDTAAAQCVVEEAGGKVSDLAGAPLRYNSKESLINPYFLVIADPAGGWERFIPEAAQS